MSFNATCSKIEHCLSKSKFEQRQLFTKETQLSYSEACFIRRISVAPNAIQTIDNEIAMKQT